MRNIGKIAATKGLDGLLKVKVYSDLEVETLENIFIENRQNSRLPFEIEYWELNTHARMNILVKLVDVDDVDHAAKLVGKEIWIDDEQFYQALPSDSSFRLLGYTLFDENQEIGEIYDIIVSAQPILLIHRGGEDIFIPLVNEWIISEDSNLKTIVMELPTGLVEANLNMDGGGERDD